MEEEGEGKGARGVVVGVVVLGWGAVHLRDWGGGGDGGRRKGKLPSVKKDKEEDIDETYREKRVGVEAHFDISPSPPSAWPESAGITKT